MPLPAAASLHRLIYQLSSCCLTDGLMAVTAVLRNRGDGVLWVRGKGDVASTIFESVEFVPFENYAAEVKNI